MAEYIEREAIEKKAVYMHGFGQAKFVSLHDIKQYYDEERTVRDARTKRRGGS